MEILAFSPPYADIENRHGKEGIIMETPDNTLYLKIYVKEHPYNKMAWYLLGKQYIEQGKEAKANYCFIQAGEIYDAYEKKRHPLAEHPQELLEQWNKQQRKKRRIKRAASIAAVFLLFAILAKSNTSKPFIETVDLPAEEQQMLPSLGVVFVTQADRKPIGSAWNSLLALPVQPALALAARMDEEDNWRKWTGRKRLLMSVSRSFGDPGAEVNMYDAASCNCKPADPTEMTTVLKQWSNRQEIRWTLASAIYQYNRLYEKWPEKLEDLIQDYPRNVLSGEGVGMRGMFPALLNALKQDQGQAEASSGEDKPASANEAAADNSLSAAAVNNGISEAQDRQWRKPLEVIVDKATHQLAVVNGDIIVRSYKVGLGGERTPEGTFYISEKVKNPNGHDDGQFGSRGMTLSGSLYAIHGTDEPDSLGYDESLGCIRMGRADVEELYDLVPLGTAVRIKNGTLPPKAALSAERFQLEPLQNETNPNKIYKWLD